MKLAEMSKFGFTRLANLGELGLICDSNLYFQTIPEWWAQIRFDFRGTVSMCPRHCEAVMTK